MFMSLSLYEADRQVLELLRRHGAQEVASLASQVQVTPTAVRQRLARLLAQGLIQRQTIRQTRGRPKYRYQVTDKGLQAIGSSLTELALAIWQTVSNITDPAQRRPLLAEIAHSLAKTYCSRIQGATLTRRMEALAAWLAERHQPVSLDSVGELPVLRSHGCPYPELAQQNFTICELEKMIFEELLGQRLLWTQELSPCGDRLCRFEPEAPA